MTVAGWTMAGLMALFVQGSAIAGEAAGYGQLLSQVYRTYHGLLAQKEACDEAFPGSRATNDKSYSAWRLRNEKTIAELNDRLGAMIRRASHDERDYARNIGKYEGGMLQQRREAKGIHLAQPRDELKLVCDALPGVLANKENDLEALYGDELTSIRSRR